MGVVVYYRRRMRGTLFKAKTGFIIKSYSKQKQGTAQHSLAAWTYVERSFLPCDTRCPGPRRPCNDCHVVLLARTWPANSRHHPTLSLPPVRGPAKMGERRRAVTNRRRGTL